MKRTTVVHSQRVIEQCDIVLRSLSSAPPLPPRWVAKVSKELKGKDVGILTRKTAEGIDIKPLYTADDVAHAAATNPLAVSSGGDEPAVPGEFPFLRGPYATMYTHRPWTVRQYAGFSTAAESNAFYRKNLAAGQQGVSVGLPNHRSGREKDSPKDQNSLVPILSKANYSPTEVTARSLPALGGGKGGLSAPE